MILIKHRVNTIKELVRTNPKYGVEIDVRSDKNKLLLNHDPFKKGELFQKWLEYYDHGTIILHVKEEGLEDSILKLMQHICKISAHRSAVECRVPLVMGIADGKYTIIQ